MEDHGSLEWRGRVAKLLDDVDALRDLHMTGRAKWDTLGRAFSALYEACIERIQDVENTILENRLSCLKNDDDDMDARVNHHLDARAMRELASVRRMKQHAEGACVWAKERFDGCST